MEQLLGEMDELRCEVQRKAHELELTRARLDEREQQLRVQGDEAKQVCQMLLRQDEQLATALSELVELRSILGAAPAPGAGTNAPEYETGSRTEPAAEAKCELAADKAETSQSQVLTSVQRQFESLRNDARRRQQFHD